MIPSVRAGRHAARAVPLRALRLTPPRLIATDIVHAIPLAVFAGMGHLLIGNVRGKPRYSSVVIRIREWYSNQSAINVEQNQ